MKTDSTNDTFESELKRYCREEWNKLEDDEMADENLCSRLKFNETGVPIHEIEESRFRWWKSSVETVIRKTTCPGFFDIDILQRCFQSRRGLLPCIETFERLVPILRREGSIVFLDELIALFQKEEDQCLNSLTWQQLLQNDPFLEGNTILTSLSGALSSAIEWMGDYFATDLSFLKGYSLFVKPGSTHTEVHQRYRKFISISKLESASQIDFVKQCSIKQSSLCDRCFRIELYMEVIEREIVSKLEQQCSHVTTSQIEHQSSPTPSSQRESRFPEYKNYAKAILVFILLNKNKFHGIKAGPNIVFLKPSEKRSLENCLQQRNDREEIVEGGKLNLSTLVDFIVQVNTRRTGLLNLISRMESEVESLQNSIRLRHKNTKTHGLAGRKGISTRKRISTGALRERYELQRIIKLRKSMQMALQKAQNIDKIRDEIDNQVRNHELVKVFAMSSRVLKDLQQDNAETLQIVENLHETLEDVQQRNDQLNDAIARKEDGINEEKLMKELETLGIFENEIPETTPLPTTKLKKEGEKHKEKDQHVRKEKDTKREQFVKNEQHEKDIVASSRSSSCVPKRKKERKPIPM
eukprot:g1056.t1